MAGKISAIILTTCLSLATADTHSIATERLTHVIDDSAFDSSVLKARNQLLYVSYPRVNNDLRIRLNSSLINGSCEITVPVPRERSFRKPQAEVLGNGRLVVGLIETRWQDADLDPKPLIRFYVIDYLQQSNCTYKNFSAVFDNRILQSIYKPFLILPYEEEFDVFMGSDVACRRNESLCLRRFNAKGDSLGTFSFDFLTNNTDVDSTKLHPLQQFSSNEGYVLVSIQNSTLRTLTSNLTVLKELKLNGYITGYSVLNGEVGVCVRNYDEVDRCLKLDARLKTESNVTLSRPYPLASTRLYNLADGGALVAVLPYWGNVRTLLRRLSPDGRVSGSELYEYDCESTSTSPKGQFTELKGGLYCFSFQCFFKEITHCVAPREARGLVEYE